MSAGVTIAALLSRLGGAGVLVYSATGDHQTTITGVTQDSRQVQPGWVYVARKGGTRDGHDFIHQAIALGAAAVVVEQAPTDVFVPVIRVSDARAALGPLAHAVAGDPSRKLAVIGVTGTNGKTTTSFLVRQLLALTSGRDDCAVLGTLGTFFQNTQQTALHTTPEADSLARQFEALVNAGAHQISMEVSSIALHAGRVRGVEFDTVAFTNLSQDHLDYHGSMQAYADAKASLFSHYPWRRAVVCVDGQMGEDFALDIAHQVSEANRHHSSLWSNAELLRVSTRADIEADLRLVAQQESLAGMRGLCSFEGCSVAFRTPLVGRYNLENLAVAFGIALGQGRDIRALAAAAEHLQGVPGRMERVSEPADGFLVTVDYSHTPDALERALQALRPSTSGALRVVFGCGGDRDRGKRPLMGEIASRLADACYLADDNPRSEDAGVILDAVLAGVPTANLARVRRIGDRERAIHQAVADAQPGDVILIAGKGHETTQTIGELVLPFDDREVARQALSMRRARG